MPGKMNALLKDVIDVLTNEYGIRPEGVERLKGGEESDIFKVTALGNDHVVRVSPSWRSVRELEWAYTRAAEVTSGMPQIPTPIKTHDDQIVTEDDGNPLSVFPFIYGIPLDRDDDDLRDQAAKLLADLHDFFLNAPAHEARPKSIVENDQPNTDQHDPHEIIDPALDQYLAETRNFRQKLRAVIHGDYYPGNVLCEAGAIRGLIDWDDCRVAGLHRDLAWATWEFCKDPVHRDRLDENRSRRFLSAYQHFNGPVPVDDLSFVVPLMRHHLRFEIRRALAAKRRGGTIDEAYLAEEIRAFQHLPAVDL